MEGVEGCFYRLLTYVLPLEIHLLRRQGWHLINRYSPATFFSADPKPGHGIRPRIITV